MERLIKCIVYNNRVYCWDEVNQRPIEAELTPKDTKKRIPDEALTLLFQKFIESNE